MNGTVAITDLGWYEFLSQQPGIDEVNFWTPSAHWAFRSEPGSPFFFKLKARYQNAICGFAFFARFVRLPDWLAWVCFGTKNGCPSLEGMRGRISGIRERINYHTQGAESQIGCILLTQPTFFPQDSWIVGPEDWPPANLRHKKYDLTAGEGLRIWEECREKAAAQVSEPSFQDLRYGSPVLVQPRLGQGTFRVAVIEAYGRACAVTGEHSLPALEAGHIQPFAQGGPHEVSNGLLLRADLHRLFDQGYVTVTGDHRLEVSPRLKLDYENGRSYYPLHGKAISNPVSPTDLPSKAFLQWHNENVYRAA